MRNSASRLLPVVLAWTLAAPFQAQSLSDLLSRSGRPLARAADVDGNGAVSPEEWSGFVDRLGADADGVFDPDRVVAHVVSAFLDRDADGSFTGTDVQALLSRLDTTADGVLEGDELLQAIPLPAAQAAGTARANAQELLLEGLVAWGIDGNLDKSVSADEWRRAVEAGGRAEVSVPTEALMGWIASTVSNAPEDPNAFGPPTMILGLKAALDATYDGRLRRDDFEKLHADLDTDGDGTLSEAELRRPDRSWAGPAHTEEEPKTYAEPLMPWQRSLDDALVLSKRLQKPLLLCVNTDGEQASESLAARRYRDPEFAALADGFIPLLASPDKHNARDYDDRGRRIHDPKFGRLTDLEHIDIEPRLYERYFNGQRVAPRHIGVAPDGTILFDLFLLNDLSVIDRHLRKHGNFDVEAVDPASQDEAALLDNPDAVARDILEATYAEGDEDTRRRLANAAMDSSRTTQHPELIRMALRDDAPDIRTTALASVAAFADRMPIEMFPEAMRVAADDPNALAAIGAALRDVTVGLDETAVVRPRRLARVSDALIRRPALDVELWLAALRGVQTAPEPAVENVDDLYRALSEIDVVRSARPNDARPQLFFSRTALRLAQHLIDTGGNPSFILEDARAAAEKAVELDLENPLSWAYLARSAYLLADFEMAGKAAARALPRLVDRAEQPIVAQVLDAFIRSRTRLVYAALGSDEGWPAAWVSDLGAAQRIQLAHPLTTDAVAQAAFETQAQLELYALQGEFLAAAVERFPASANLHHYLRWQRLRDVGAAGLVQTYSELKVADGERPTLAWFAGLAAFRAAEHLVENRQPQEALAAYESSIQRFSDSVDQEPSFAASADYYVALAWAGMARLHLDSGDLDAAVVALRESVEVDAGVLEDPDGLGNSPGATGRAIARALRQDGRYQESEDLRYLIAGEGPQPAPPDTE